MEKSRVLDVSSNESDKLIAINYVPVQVIETLKAGKEVQLEELC